MKSANSCWLSKMPSMRPGVICPATFSLSIMRPMASSGSHGSGWTTSFLSEFHSLRITFMLISPTLVVWANTSPQSAVEGSNPEEQGEQVLNSHTVRNTWVLLCPITHRDAQVEDRPRALHPAGTAVMCYDARFLLRVLRYCSPVINSGR